ncbi:MAG: RING-HC finger protein [Candidatus Thorarchaeota archaeon]|jgi:hypothetical protein
MKLIYIANYMINDTNSIDNSEESEDISLNDIENPESDDISIESNGEDIRECPICIEPKGNMYALVCGHTVCTECKTLLIQHNQLNVCPLCRFPLNWNGILQLYEGGDNVPFSRHVVGEIVNANISPPENIRQPEANRDIEARHIRIHRERAREFAYNMCAAIVGVIFIILFWVLIADNHV